MGVLLPLASRNCQGLYDHSLTDLAASEQQSTQEIWDLANSRIRELVPETDVSAAMLLFALFRAADRITYDLEAVHRAIGWSWAGFRVLFWVWLMGPLEPREIARLTSASRASVSSALNTLERDGFVVRRRTSGDRRLVTVELTARARERIATAFGAHNVRAGDWAAVFDEQERVGLFELLSRLVDQRPDGIAP